MPVGDGASWRFALPPSGAVTIGRVAGCEIELKDPTASRKHAQRRVDGARILVSDLGSYLGLLRMPRRTFVAKVKEYELAEVARRRD